jgi:PAS domain S-box-containing protein
VIEVLLSSAAMNPDDISSGMIFTALDITERKRAEEALLKSRESLKEAQRIARLGGWEMDLVNNTVICSDEAYRILGLTEETYDGTQEGFLNIVHPDDREFVKKAAEESLAEHKPFEMDYRVIHPDGTERIIHSHAQVKFDESGGAVKLTGTLQDVTDRRHAEKKLRETHEELQKAYKDLEEAQASAIVSEKLAAVGRLTAGVSHEILNPLNFITMCLQRLLDDSDHDPELAEDLRNIQEHSNRIVKITQGLLSFSRQRTPERRPIDLNKVVINTLALLEYDLKLQNIDVEMNLAEDLPSIQADEDQLCQVVLNLLTNARDVMPKGGRLVLGTAGVEPLFADKEGTVELRVEDTGPGIPPGEMDKLFDPFYTTKEEGKGTGLGLSICQGIVEAHGGSIWAENASGGGAVFFVQLVVEGG